MQISNTYLLFIIYKSYISIGGMVTHLGNFRAVEVSSVVKFHLNLKIRVMQVVKFITIINDLHTQKNDDNILIL